MKKERVITIKVIKNNKTNMNKLADFFARKYCGKHTNEQNEKS
jgi:hypothetical protein